MPKVMDVFMVIAKADSQRTSALERVHLESRRPKRKLAVIFWITCQTKVQMLC